MNDEIFCTKCASKMVMGFIPEVSSGVSVSAWVEGEPEYSFWAAGVKVPTEKMINIVTFCCEKCGFLESYARKKPHVDTQRT